MRTRVIFGCSGPVLTAEEKAFFQDVRPWGFILFARNIEDPQQVKALTRAMRETVEDPAAPILIDQEGGRVARLKPPHWRLRPPAARFGAVFAKSSEDACEAAYLNARLIAYDLSAIGVNVDCMPVLDLPVEGADAVIGDRAYARDPAAIIALGRATMDGLMEGDVLPVMKHIPGHGRAMLDSHQALPRVSTKVETLSATDFVTFRSLNSCPMAMTAHVVYEAIDDHRPATTSPKIIRDVIRGEIGFDGVLMSDDLSMGALEGPIKVRTKAALFADCDIVLHCNGAMTEMRDVAAELKPIEATVQRRVQHVMSLLSAPSAFDPAQAEARLEALLGASP